MQPRLPSYSVVIPYYNNKSIIPVCLPSVIELSKQYNRITEIIGFDDCSTDGTVEFLKEHYPQITIKSNSKNLGFGKTCNKAISSAQNEWIILLNADIKIAADIITRLDKLILSVSDLFQVGFYSFSENGEPFESQKFIICKTGLFKPRNNFSSFDDSSVYDSMYACGGHTLLSKSKFLELGGFSQVYEPFYSEDADISYMGLKRGWRVLFDPGCKVIHCHRGSSIRTSNSTRTIDIIQTRNKILFFWKNVSSWILWIQHITGFSFRILTSWIIADLIFYIALYKAFQKVPQLLKERTIEKKHWKVTDNTLFKIGKSK